MINIQTSYSIFNCLHLCDLFDYYTKHLNHKGALSISPWYSPKPFTAPLAQANNEILYKAKDQLNEMQMRLGRGIGGVKWRPKELRKFLTMKWNDINEQKLLFVKSIDKFDKLRNTNFLKTFPELQSLYAN